VLLLFIGRQHLYLRQTDDARRAFEEALQRDPDYLRAHLGLGDAHCQRVALLPADQRLDSPELDQAIGEYQFVFERAPQAVDAPLLTLSARLSLGYGRALKGGALYQRDQLDQAETELLAAVDLLNSALDALDGQYRRLGQAYEAIGRSYMQLADIADARGDTAEGKRRYQAARWALQNCLAQGGEGRGLTDEFLVNNIIRPICRPNLDTVNQALSSR
jgi:tetratricopeptide (TPR) repeat protein